MVHPRHARNSTPATEGRRRLLWRALVGAFGVALVATLGFAVADRDSAGTQPPTIAGPDDGSAWRGGIPPQFTASATPGATSATSPSATPSQSQPTTTPNPAPPKPTIQAPPKAATKPATAPAGQRVQAYITGYSYFDNTPPGSAAISHPILHQSAGGTGTYADPITVAVGHSLSNDRQSLDWAAGTRFYLPNLRRYFIVEDTCGDGATPQNGPCHTGYASPATTWLDIWVGGQGGSESGSTACMNAITAVWDVWVNPGPNYATVAGSVYGSAGCAKQYGNHVLLS